MSYSDFRVTSQILNWTKIRSKLTILSVSKLVVAQH